MHYRDYHRYFTNINVTFKLDLPRALGARASKHNTNWVD